MISMGAAMDSKTLREAALAHHSAILGVDKKGVLSEGQFIEINDRIGHLIASVPEKTTMDVYKSVSALVDPKVPAYLMSTVKEADAKANPIASSTPVSTVSAGAASSIGAVS